MGRKYVSFTLIALVLAATPVIGYQIVRQAGGDDFPEVVLRTVSGPYRVVIGTIPDRAAIGALHLAVNLMTAEKSAPAKDLYARMRTADHPPVRRRRPVTDAVVTVVGRGPHGNRLHPVHALNSSVDRQYYDATLALPVAGKWFFTVTIASALGSTVVAVPLQVYRAALPWGLILRWAIPAALLLAATLYTINTRRKGTPGTGEARKG